MRRTLLIVLALLLLVIPSITASSKGSGDETVLKFTRMVAVDGPYVGPTNPIRGVPGGNAPWAISEGKVTLSSSGKLQVKVRGLILPGPPFNGTNPLPDFRAMVMCNCIDGSGNPSVVSISTGLYPATTTGNSDIEETLSLPSPCIDPVVFVMHPAAGRWFAVTGF